MAHSDRLTEEVPGPGSHGSQTVRAFEKVNFLERQLFQSVCIQNSYPVELNSTPEVTKHSYRLRSLTLRCIYLDTCTARHLLYFAVSTCAQCGTNNFESK